MAQCWRKPFKTAVVVLLYVICALAQAWSSCGFRFGLVPLVMLMQVVANQSLQLVPFFTQFF
jgi:hypothetical protein